MLQFVNFVLNLFLLLPWWGAVAVLVGLAAGFWLLGKYLVHKMFRDVFQAVARQGVALTDALVTVHSAEPAERPTERSAFDSSPDDDDYDAEADEDWLDDNAEYVWIDATIAPTDPAATWDPSALSLVSRDFEPEEELDLCEQTAVLHTLEVWHEGRFHPSGEGDVTGPQRLRMLFVLPNGLRDAKFAYHFTYFGEFTLPSLAGSAGSGRAKPRHIVG